jgi:hypothetical protein
MSAAEAPANAVTRSTADAQAGEDVCGCGSWFVP